MESLDFPPYDLAPLRREGALWIHDPIRRRQVRCTPEEWVRQHVLRYLLDAGGYPAGLVGVESAFAVGERQWRADVVCFGRDGAPLLLVECKAPHIALDEAVLDQLARYNRHLNASALYVTNGRRHFVWWRPEGPDAAYEPLARIPTYEDLRRA